jgi:osomolarity two-component system, phosphorelay intermediate protein YPD1
MAPTLRTLDPVNPRTDDKHTRPRSPPYPSPPNEDTNPIEKHLSKPRPQSPRPTSPKPRPVENAKAAAQVRPSPVYPSVASHSQKPQPQVEDEEEEEEEPNRDDIIDMEVLGQLLELDEDDPDFSKEMAFAYFSQAETTFIDLDAAL